METTFDKFKLNNEDTYSFIPFEVREKFDSSFKWNNLLKKGLRENYKDYKFDNNYDYMEYISNLIMNKNIIFYQYGYIHDDVNKKCLLVDFPISFNSSGILVIYNKERTIGGAVDERRPITIIKPKIIYSEEDPYGEEDWNDYENINFNI